MKIPVPGKGTVLSCQSPRSGILVAFTASSAGPLTVVNLCYSVGYARDGGWLRIERLEPIAHRLLRAAIVPYNVEQG